MILVTKEMIAFVMVQALSSHKECVIFTQRMYKRTKSQFMKLYF